MELIEGIKTRRSIRRFTPRSIPHELIETIVSNAAYAPSWKNVQPARYRVVEDPALLERIADEAVLNFAFNAKTISHAPALVLLTCVKGRSGYERDGSFSTDKGDGWTMFDAGAAAETFCLAAHAAGLGSVILGIFDETLLRSIVTLPETEQLAALIAIGFPAETPEAPRRKEVTSLLTFEG